MARGHRPRLGRAVAVHGIVPGSAEFSFLARSREAQPWKDLIDEDKSQNKRLRSLIAKARKGERERCLHAGASEYLPKPIDGDRLLSALQSLLDPEEWADFRLCGKSDSAIRERVGNAVPSDAAAR